jgi:hypothetical protein
MPLVTGRVIKGSLLSPMYSDHGHSMRLVEVRDRQVVLQFSVLDHYAARPRRPRRLDHPGQRHVATSGLPVRSPCDSPQ